MATLQKITRDVLEAYLLCKTKGLLVLAGESGTKTDYENWYLRVAAQQEARSAANFEAHYQGRSLRRDVALTPSEITNAPDAILRAYFSD
jgi:hypothetical protein